MSDSMNIDGNGEKPDFAGGGHHVDVYFPGWEPIQFIGGGRNQGVWKIRKIGTKQCSALKIIHIPLSDGDIAERKALGHSDSEINAYYDRQKDHLINILEMLMDHGGHPNIVNYQEYAPRKKSHGYGWEIFVRMELLTPLEHWITEKNNEIHDVDVIKVGKDICSALQWCSENGIVHRDIKPQNIFVNKYGNFKLGDFDSALIKTYAIDDAAFYAPRGTKQYMAPEVYNNREDVDIRSDIYSLGLVMYWMLNEMTLPFLPIRPEPYSNGEVEEAIGQRLKGRRLLPPATGGKRLINIVDKACTFNPNKRFSSVEEMSKAFDDEFYIEEPDIKEPDIKEPDIKEPDIKEPDIKEPDIKEPDIKDTDIEKPGSNEPSIFEIIRNHKLLVLLAVTGLVVVMVLVVGAVWNLFNHDGGSGSGASIVPGVTATPTISVTESVVMSVVPGADKSMSESNPVSSGEHDKSKLAAVSYLKDKVQEECPIQTFETDEKIIEVASYTYENAIAAMALMSEGDYEDAFRILDELVYGMNGDVSFKDRFRNAYMVGASEESSDVPGYWDYAKGMWIQDYYQVGASVKSNCAAAYALLLGYKETHKQNYIETAENAINWVICYCNDDENAGFTSGYTGWMETNNSENYDVLTYKSTADNIWMAAACMLYKDITGYETFDGAARNAYIFVTDNMYSEQDSRFYQGTMDDGKEPFGLLVLTDVQALAELCIGKEDGMDNMKKNKAEDGGYSYSNAYCDGSWIEGTAIAALALKDTGDLEAAEKAISFMEEKQLSSGAFPQASVENLETGEKGRAINDWPSVGACSWYILAVNGSNPFDGISHSLESLF